LFRCDISFDDNILQVGFCLLRPCLKKDASTGWSDVAFYVYCIQLKISTGGKNSAA